MKITDFNDWSLDQHRAAMRAFTAYEQAHKGHPLYNGGSFDRFIRKLQDGVIRAAFIDSYIVAYDFGQTWCSDAPVFLELLTTKTDLPDGGDFASYVAGLKELAKQNECVGVMTGNGVLRRGLRKKYLDLGFTVFNEAYFTEV